MEINHLVSDGITPSLGVADVAEKVQGAKYQMQKHLSYMCSNGNLFLLVLFAMGFIYVVIKIKSRKVILKTKHTRRQKVVRGDL